jgi:hypothetical protein
VDGGLVYEAWCLLLPTDYPNKEFILEGVKDGFTIVDISSITTPAEAPNHPSATSSAHRDKVEQLILNEVTLGHYRIVNSTSTICSPLAAIPKADGSLRLIHDGSRPAGTNMNAYAQPPPVHYQSFEDAITYLQRGMYMCKVDLKAAYRSVKIKESNWAAIGLQWKFKSDDKVTYLIDTRLPFGASLSPHIFNTLSQAVRHIIASYGVPISGIVAYLDDFWLAAESYEECQQMLLTTIHILRRLGFTIAWDKVVGPTKRITFLGLEICSQAMTVNLPTKKLHSFRKLLLDAVHRRASSKRQLQSLIGKLNWITRCVYGGRAFLRRLIDFAQPLRKPGHRKRLTRAIYEDLRWWLVALSHVDRRSVPIIDNRDTTHVFIDASERGLGAVWQMESVLTPFIDNKLPIAYREALALLPAVIRWASHWANKKIIVHCDNTAAVNIITKGTCAEQLVLQALRQVWMLSVQFNFRVCARYIQVD